MRFFSFLLPTVILYDWNLPSFWGSVHRLACSLSFAIHRTALPSRLSCLLRMPWGSLLPLSWWRPGSLQTWRVFKQHKLSSMPPRLLLPRPHFGASYMPWGLILRCYRSYILQDLSCRTQLSWFKYYTITMWIRDIQSSWIHQLPGEYKLYLIMEKYFGCGWRRYAHFHTQVTS